MACSAAAGLSNMMILMDETARNLGSIGITYILFQIGSILNDVGDLSYCPFLHLAIIGIFWNIIDQLNEGLGFMLWLNQ